MPKISKNIKKLRAERNLTQDALATKIHVTRQAISNWENDKTKPDIEALESLAQAFGVDIEELIYGEKKEVIISQEKTTEKKSHKSYSCNCGLTSCCLWSGTCILWLLAVFACCYENNIFCGANNSRSGIRCLCTTKKEKQCAVA